MRNPAFCICENKDADQLRALFSLYIGFIEIDQILFNFIKGLYFLLNS